MTHHPDHITLEEQQSVDIKAQHAKISLRIEGDSPVFGNEALKKSKVLASFIDELVAINFPKDQVVLDNMSLSASQGKLINSSAVKFYVSLINVDIAVLAGVLNVIAQQKHVILQSIDYDFGSLTKEKSALMREVCLSLKQQAQDMGLALGVSVLGIYNLVPRWEYPSREGHRHAEFSTNALTMKTRAGSSAQGLEIVTNKIGRLSLSVSAEFLISKFADQPLPY